jgi:two-component system cell cycle response regulator PopA
MLRASDSRVATMAGVENDDVASSRKGKWVTLHPRVLIVAKDDTLAGPLAEGLDRLGWRTITARGPYAALAALGDLEIEVAIIDVAQGADEAATLARRLKASCSPRSLPVIAIGVPSDGLAASDFDLVLAPPLHPAQAALRLESLTRMTIAEEEFGLRLETFGERGRKLDLPTEPTGPYRVLAIGEPAPQFLALSNALTEGGAEVVGAFTAYTAFDYLHEQAFDAVVLWAGENQAEALSIAAGMRRNTRLYHVPALLYLQSPAQIGLAEAYHRGVSDLATPDIVPGETAKRVIELARAYRRQNAIREALEKARRSGLMDAPTGLFTRELFAAHLARLVQASRLRNRALSLCVLRVSERVDLAQVRAGGWLDRAIPQIGSMIGRLIRAEDTAARLGPEVFALALPATNQSAARAAGERIAAVIACTAFDSGDDRPPFVVEFEIGVAQVEPGENGAKALERAAARALHIKVS